MTPQLSAKTSAIQIWTQLTLPGLLEQTPYFWWGPDRGVPRAGLPSLSQAPPPTDNIASDLKPAEEPDHEQLH